MALQLVIGNKNYSSWSMRPWVLMKQLGIPFEEMKLRFCEGRDTPFHQAVARFSPAGLVPVLVDDGFNVWDTLAITEYLHEKFPGAGVWPADTKARARARSIASEMHAGFGALRSHCTMNIEAVLPEVGARLWAEQEGVRRSEAAARQAELVLHVLDASSPWRPDEPALLAGFDGTKRLLVLNKTDLPTALELPPELVAGAVRVSCLTGTGLEDLKAAIRRKVWAGEVRAEMLEVMINARHADALRRAREALERATAALTEGLTLELAASDLRVAVNAVGEIVGETATEDLLDRIFREFCIGK